MHFLPFSISLSSSFSGKSRIEWNISLCIYLVKTATKLLCFWVQSLLFQKAFMLLLIISPMLTANPKNAKITYPFMKPRATSKVIFWNNFFSPITLFQLSIHLRTLQQRNSNLAENLHYYSLPVYWQEKVILVL